MNALAAISQRYAEQADRIVKRNTNEEGVYDDSAQSSVDYYRNASAACARLAEGVEESDEADFSALEVEGGFAQSFGKKVSTRDKAATPQELIEKANG